MPSGPGVYTSKTSCRSAAQANGAIAQLGERLDRTQEVGGSSPPSSTEEPPASGRFFGFSRGAQKDRLLLPEPASRRALNTSRVGVTNPPIAALTFRVIGWGCAPRRTRYACGRWGLSLISRSGRLVRMRLRSRWCWRGRSWRIRWRGGRAGLMGCAWGCSKVSIARVCVSCSSTMRCGQLES